MRSYFTHKLDVGDELTFSHCPRDFLALVDLESYPAFVAREVDHLDLMAHLFAQMRALTAIAWGAPGQTLRIRLILTEDDRLAQGMAATQRGTFASGSVRTGGQLCFTSHDRLRDCACHRTHDLLREQPLASDARPHLLLVPPGVYSVQVFYHFAIPGDEESEAASLAEPKEHFTVVLRHYPFPAPRVAPIRLPGLVPWAA